MYNRTHWKDIVNSFVVINNVEIDNSSNSLITTGLNKESETIELVNNYSNLIIVNEVAKKVNCFIGIM